VKGLGAGGGEGGGGSGVGGRGGVGKKGGEWILVVEVWRVGLGG